MSNKKITDAVLLEELRKRFEEKEAAISGLKDLTNELKGVNSKLQASEQLKSNFIANINNEIVNPFASVLGLSRTILEVKENDWDKAKYMAKLIFVEAHNLDFQLKNIFAAAQIEAGQVFPQISKVDVLQLIQGVLDDFENDLASKRLKPKVTNKATESEEDTFYFRTDPEKLKLIFSNLISNAIKFSKGANIDIVINKVNKSLVVSVRDYGIGISEKNKEIIFDRFTRLDTGINSINRGHGLGLSVVKAFIELFDGDINIESSVGKGSVFTITIPEPEVGEGFEGYSSEGNEVFFGDEDEIF
jgi:signal transduction histidine kinase